MTKSITVQSNDPATPRARLTIKGVVNRFATIQPNRVSLVGPVGVKLTQVVSIIPEAVYPFAITSHRAEKGQFIRYELIEKKEGQTLRYDLVVENIKTDTGWYSDVIILTTDSAVRPELRIRVNGNIKEKSRAKAAPTGETSPQSSKEE